MLSDILKFLPCETPDAWLGSALIQKDILLIDHANCEKKAAATAMNLLYRYVEHQDLMQKMSQLAREELLHFQQVVTLMARRGVRYLRIGPSRYASALRQDIRTDREGVLVDTLIVGAFVEARSCERFARLAPRLDEEQDREVGKFYRSLLRSEARHFQDYLELARRYSSVDITPRVRHFADVEKELIQSADTQFRFHSGVPA